MEEEEEYPRKILPRVIKVKLNDLEPHPTALDIYDYKNSKKEIKVLAKTMAAAGQLEPIVINSKNQIVSGVRRYKAAYSLNWTEIEAIRTNNLPEAEIVSIVYHNQQRKKKINEIIKEAEAILGLLKKKQGERRDLLKEQKDNPFGGIGKDRYEKAASVIGDISASTLRKLMHIVEFEKKADANLELGLVEKVIKYGLPPNRAFAMMKSFLEEKKEREERKSVKIKPTFTKDDVSIYNKSSAKMEEIKTGSIQVVLTSPPYYNLRNYGNSIKGKPELGHETSPQEFVNNLSTHFKDVSRVLKKTGSFFLNIGETYNRKENLLIPTRFYIT